jgi:hypothetical protein
MGQTRKQRLIAMRKTIGYHPHHPRKEVMSEFQIPTEDKMNHPTGFKTCRMRQTSAARQKYQELKKAGI